MWYGASVMNILCRLFVLLFCFSAVLPVSGDDADSVEKPAVVKALSGARVLGKKKPNLNARFYMFLRSASWCVPCHIIVPKLMKDYGKMKGAQMELIFIGQEDEATVKKYMKEHKFKCPGIMGGVAIPGLDFEGFGFPSACIVTADGQFVVKSGGVGMYEWKNQLKAKGGIETNLQRWRSPGNPAVPSFPVLLRGTTSPDGAWHGFANEWQTGRVPV